MSISGVNGSSAADLKAQLEALKAQQQAAKAEKDGADSTKTEKSGAKDNAQSATDTAQSNQATASANKSEADSVKSQAEAAKNTADNNYQIAQNATNAARTAETAAGTAWQAACSAVSVAQSALSSAIAAATEDNPNTSAINSARAALSRAQENERKAKEAFNQAIEAREKAEEAEANAKEVADQAAAALEAAEAEAENAAQLLEEAEAALTEAQEKLDSAISELEEAEQALTAATENLNQVDEEVEIKTEEVKEAEEAEKNDVTHMSVEEAEAAGYTVIPADVTPEQLQAILASNMNGKYILSSDVDLKDFDWSSVGSVESPFRGEFNGNGYTISNLTITSTDPLAENIGFFGVTDGAKIIDVNFDNATITTDGVARNIGLVVGTASGTHIENVTATGSLNGHSAVGGIVGLVDDSTKTGDSYFDNVHANVQVDGSYHTGGIIGRVSNAGGNLKINNCSSEGNMDIEKMGGGGIIGKAGKRVITVDHCDSKMQINLGVENPNNYDEGYVGGIIGCADGTYIAICNCTYDGNLEDWQSSYGGYRYGAHVSVYDVKEGLTKDDILKISFLEGVDGVRQVTDADGNPVYEVTISTINGLDNLVDIIRKNPELAESLKYNLSFDFDAMNAKYDSTVYQQYGIVETITGSREEGTVSRSVYFDNEVDAYHEYHDFQRCGGGGGGRCSSSAKCSNFNSIFYNETFIEGLFTDDEGNYYVQLEDGTMLKIENMKYDPSKTWEENLEIAKRLSEEQIKEREKLIAASHERQEGMYNTLKEQYGNTYGADDDLPVVDEAERDRLAQLSQMGISLSSDEKIASAKYDIDKEIGLAEMKATGNTGCAMGGNAPGLDTSASVDHDGFNDAMNKLEDDIKNGKYSADKY